VPGDEFQAFVQPDGKGLAGTDPRKISEERRNSVAEQMIEAKGVELCAGPFGDPTDPPIPRSSQCGRHIQTGSVAMRPC
jgi:hypothetical protein